MYKLEDVYNDFFGVEKEIKEKVSTETVEKEKSSPDDFMKEKFDKIKSLTFMWLKARFFTLPFNFHGWWLSPFTILGIG